MAIAYGSAASANKEHGGDPDSLTITKPSGLSSGDLMIAILGANGAASNYSLSGWTEVEQENNATNFGLQILTKVADAGDAAASDFSFSLSASATTGMVGAIVRLTGTFTGGGVPNIVSTTPDVITSATTTHTFTPGMTPATATSLFLLGAFGRGDTTQSGYAITNNNPTWTERVDEHTASLTQDVSLSVATAPVSAASATGDYNVTFASSLEAVGYLLSVEENTSATVTHSETGVTLSNPEPTIGAGSVITIDAPGVITLSTPAFTPESTSITEWTNQNEDTDSTWTNQDLS